MNTPLVDSPPPAGPKAPVSGPDPAKRIYLCDRYETVMVERGCKITCPNCGNRFDCSGLKIYFD
jgi:hypothetical protein